MTLTLEETLKRYSTEEALAEGGALAVAEDGLVATHQELVNASVLLAKTTRESAEQLAKTTRESAEQLAKTTRESAEQLKRCNEVSVRQIERLTIVVIGVGLVQLAIAVIALAISLQ